MLAWGSMGMNGRHGPVRNGRVRTPTSLFSKRKVPKIVVRGSHSLHRIPPSTVAETAQQRNWYSEIPPWYTWWYFWVLTNKGLWVHLALRTKRCVCVCVRGSRRKAREILRRLTQCYAVSYKWSWHDILDHDHLASSCSISESCFGYLATTHTKKLS